MSNRYTKWVINSDLVSWTSGGHFCYFNLVSNPTVSILTKEAQYLLSAHSTPLTSSQAIDLIIRKDPNTNKKFVNSIYQLLKKRNLIIKLGGVAKSNHKAPRRLGVWLHLTNQCNLRCTYCYITKSNLNFNKSNLPTTLDTIFSSAQKHNFKAITLKISGGECLLKLTDVLTIVEQGYGLSKKYKISFRPIVMTNGTLITPKTAHTLKQHHIHMAVSLDGIGKYHNKTRIFPSGLGSYKATYEGIKNLQKAKASFNCLITITNQNEANLISLTRLLLKNSIPFAFNFYRENEASTAEGLINSDNQLINTLKKCYRLIAKSNPHTSLLRYFLDRVDLTHTHRQVCGRGSSYLVIGADGALYPCQMDIGHTPLAPNISSDPIFLMQKWGSVHPNTMIKECNSCPYQHYCAGGCPRLHNSVNKNPYCNIYQALIPYLLRLESKRIIKNTYA